MPASASPTEPPGRERRELNRRTWEIELLISGAIVVALFKLPGAVDGLYNSLTPHISRDLHFILWSLYWPAKLILTPTLIVFLCHILLRGLWVGLLGLNAIFPAGVDWERANVSLFVRRFLEGRLDMMELERKVDQAASLLFALLFSVIGVFTTLGLWIAVSQLGVLAAASLGLVSGDLSRIGFRWYLAAVGLIWIPAVAAGLLDKLAERRPKLRERSRFGRLVTALFRFSYYVLMMPVWYGLSLSLQSNLVRRKPTGWKAVAWGLSLGTVLSLLAIGPLVGGRIFHRLDSYVYSPNRMQESGLHSASYRSLAPADRSPNIQSDQVSDPFLRLYLPYDARRDNQRLAEVCPDAEPFRQDGDLLALLLPRPSDEDHRHAVLSCFGRLWHAELNGREVELDLLFTDEPDGRGRGLVAYIPVDGLPGGRHDLVLERKPTEKEKSRRRFDPEAHRFYIPFWKG